MEPILREKLAAGRISRAEFDHLMAVDAQAQVEEERGVYELSAKDLSELNPKEIERMMAEIKTGKVDVDSAMGKLHQKLRGDSSRDAPKPVHVDPGGVHKQASFKLPPPPPPPPAAEPEPVASLPAAQPGPVSGRRSRGPLPSPTTKAQYDGAVAPQPAAAAASPAAVAGAPDLHAEIERLKRENEAMRHEREQQRAASAEPQQRRSAADVSNVNGRSSSVTPTATPAGDAAAKKGKGRKRRVLPQLPPGSRGPSRGASPAGRAPSRGTSVSPRGSEGSIASSTPAVTATSPSAPASSDSPQPTEGTPLKSVAEASVVSPDAVEVVPVARPAPAAQLQQAQVIKIAPKVAPRASPPSARRQAVEPPTSSLRPQSQPQSTASAAAEASNAHRPKGGVAILPPDGVAEVLRRKGSPKPHRRDAAASKGRSSPADAECETTSGSFRPATAPPMPGIASAADIKTMSRGGWGGAAAAAEGGPADLWRFQGEPTAANAEAVAGSDDGAEVVDNEAIAPPKDSALQKRRRKPTKAGDETAGKSAYSIKQRNRRMNQVQQRLNVYADDISEWLNELIGFDEPLVAETLMTSLETGVVLCQLAHCVHESITSWRYPTMLSPDKLLPPKYTKMVRGPFQARDNVSNFITWVTELGVPCLFESEDLVLHKSDMQVLYCLMDVARGAVDCIDVLPHLVQFEQEIDAGESVVELAAADDGGEEIEVTTTASLNLRSEEEEVRAAMFLQEEAKRQEVAMAAARAQELARLEQERAAREEEMRLAAIEEEQRAIAAMEALELEMQRAEEAARILEEQRIHEQEEARALEEARRLKEAEEMRLAEEARIVAEEQERRRQEALRREQAEREERERHEARRREEEEKARQAEAEAARIAAEQEAARLRAAAEAQREAELAAEEAEKVRLAELERRAREQQQAEEIERLKAEVLRAQREAQEAAERAEAERRQREAEIRSAEEARLKAEEEERLRALEAERLRQEALIRERAAREAKEREAARLREAEERQRVAKLRAAEEEARRREAARRAIEEEERRAAELERLRQEAMAREVALAKKKAAEAARRKRAAEKRAKDEAEKAAQREAEAAEAKRLEAAAAAAREVELAKLKADESNAYWLQEALRLEKEAAKKRKSKAKAAVAKKGKGTKEIPKELQDRMQKVGIERAGEGKYLLGKQALNVRIYKEHLVVRVGGGWDTLENYLFDHFKTREGLKGHVLVKDGSGVPKWEKAPEMSKYVNELQHATGAAVNSVAKQLKDGEIKDDEVKVNASLALVGGSASLNKISGFAKRPSQERGLTSPSKGGARDPANKRTILKGSKDVKR